MGIIYFVVLLGVIVTIHELGHFIAAKLFRVYCGEFSIGMGPKLFSIQGKETKYSIRLFPMGGYVAMAGDVENALEETVKVDVPKERTVKGIAHWKQIVIMLAGILMNFVLAICLFTGIVMSQGVTTSLDVPQVGTIIEESPADLAGFQVGDRVIRIDYANGKSIEPQTFSEMSAANLGLESVVRYYTLDRDGSQIVIEVTPQFYVASNAYLIGINAPVVVEFPPIFESVKIAVNQMFSISGLVFGGLADLFRGKNLDQLSGPIGIYTVTKEQASLGLVNYVWLIALLSLNVGIFNSLPLPILDGGRAILVMIEFVRGKPINQKLEQGMMTFGLIAMMVLFIISTWQDIVRLFLK